MVSEEETTLEDPPLGVLDRHRTPLVVIAHGVLFGAALLAAFCLAYNFRWIVGDRRWFYELYLPLLVLAVPIKLLIFLWRGQHRGTWRYVGLRDLFSVTSAALAGSFVFLGVYFLLENIWRYKFGHPLIDRGAMPFLRQSSVFSLDWACTVGFVSAARILVRFYYEDIQPQRSAEVNRVLIVGASDTGEALVRQLFRMRRDRYDCVGFVDDSAQPHSRIHGVEVLGSIKDIREICVAQEVQEVLIALPHATPRVIRDLVERCEGTGVLFRTIPAVTDVIEGRVTVSQIRDVDIADLLGREPVELDTQQIGEQLRGQRVLVTGAGGSIGAEICRQVAQFDPKRLVLLEQSENGLFEIDRELRRRYPELDVVPAIADIVDETRLKRLYADEQPSIVFHAAAHKHVPMMEINPGEAVKNNIGGTVAVANAALAAGVKTMVMVSTDKAVNPTSVMGCSKRVAEMYVQGLAGRGTTSFITVRFGNVLGSSGSVVPIFQKQIASGGPVTVTHPEMVRYFMTIPEAVHLVLQASAMGANGEMFVLNMGEPVKIMDLAEDMIRLSGLEPGEDIEIVITGMRPGEKLTEELWDQDAEYLDTQHPDIRRVNEPQMLRGKELKQTVTELARLAKEGDTAAIIKSLGEIIPGAAIRSTPPPELRSAV
ncbi:MAG: polysaccharide biosynthesis protein [Planctomycetes bacterium]|nr:polysaccharide biosynthesis protein [Planctomycetota bacterium]